MIKGKKLISIWTIEDVKGHAKEMLNFDLDDAQALEVLELMNDRHDSNNGLTWAWWNLMDDCINSLGGL
jgi:hypothetical protein